MLIRMPENFCYDFISDDLDGEITFVVAQGQLFVDLLGKNGKVEHFKLEPGDALFTKRRVFRKTWTKEEACLYYENLTGGFNPSRRIKMNG